MALGAVKFAIKKADNRRQITPWLNTNGFIGHSTTPRFEQLL